jgi:hypothetical protein
LGKWRTVIWLVKYNSDRLEGPTNGLNRKKIAHRTECVVNINPSKLFGALLGLLFSLMLTGCATNSAITLINASKKTEPQLPNSSVINTELKGRSFEIGNIYLDIPNNDPKERLGIPGSDIIDLLSKPLHQGFLSANLASGQKPSYSINVAVIEIKLKSGISLFPSVFRLRMEIARPDQTKIMSAELESRYSNPILVPGGALPGYASPLTALSSMLPATAVVITRTVLGLQKGNGLDKIKVYPEQGFSDPPVAGGVIYPPYMFFEGTSIWDISTWQFGPCNSCTAFEQMK